MLGVSVETDFIWIPVKQNAFAGYCSFRTIHRELSVSFDGRELYRASDLDATAHSE